MRKLLLIVGLGLVAPVLAISTGDEVNHIPHANDIVAWRVLGADRMELTTRERQRYMVTLKQDCVQLGVAEEVGFTTSNNAIYAGFDYVTADNAQCAIRRINRLPINL